VTTPKAELKVNATGAAWAVVASMRAHRGIGIARIGFEVEVSPRIPEVAGALLSLAAHVRVRTPPTMDGFLCDVAADRQYTQIIEPGTSASFSLQGTIGLRQLKAIEDARTAGVTLELSLFGHWVIKADHFPFWSATVEHDVEQSAWVNHLSGWGYRNLLLLEFDQPTVARTKELQAAFNYLAEARQRFLAHEPRHTVESLRQCLASIVGATADGDETAAQVDDALKVARKEARPGGLAVGYDQRFELVRSALKFASDIAAHPEVDETSLVEAESLLIMTAGLLYRLAR
jgi:hypothetical protein